ncbi:MAG: VWA domain-containing protein, partial [Polyangiaceae bacterium]
MSFQVAAFQNRFLTSGQSRVDAILTVTADAAMTSTSGELMVGFIIDKSGSMAAERMESAKRAVIQGLEMLDEKAWFFVVAFDSMAQVVSEEMQATAANKAEAKDAIEEMTAGGGTAMSTGLRAALRIFERRPNAIRQCIFLTDGKNESEASDLVRKALES